MDFALSEEQQLLAEMVGRFVAREYSFETRRTIKNSEAGYSREVWQSLAELGLLGLNTPEGSETPAEGIANTMVVMNAFGAGLLLEPYLESAVVATSLIRELASPEQQTAWLPEMARGESIAVLAAPEQPSRHDLAHVETRALPDGDGVKLRGQKTVIAHAGAADRLLITARVAGADADVEGISLFAVPYNAPGLVLTPYRMVDGRRGADIVLADVALPAADLVGPPGGAFEAVERARDIGIAALAAEAVGAMTTLVDITVDYLKTRSQFGQPIGRFQALQHRIAEMLVHCEQSKSIGYLAAEHCLAADAIERHRACSAAKVLIGRGCRFVRQQALQLHGGMGMTDELNVSHYFKRLLAIEASFGDADFHLERFARVSRG